MANRYNFLERVFAVDWTSIQIDNDNNMSVSNIIKKYNINVNMVNKACELGLFNKNLKTYVMTDEQKKHVSIKRKEWISNNLDKFKESISKSRISIPCEQFKNKLKNLNFIFIEEYKPLSDRNFHIDIAFPDKLIGIEINGNFHYNRDGTLKKYYQDRHNLLVQHGWNIIEIPYTQIYNTTVLDNVVNIITNSTSKIEFDFQLCIQQQLQNSYEKHNKQCCDCQTKIQYSSTRCINCSKKLRKNKRNRRKIVPPELESGPKE